MQQLFYCILYCFTLLFSRPPVKMMYHQCSIQNKENTREALLKKIANTDPLFSTARMHTGSNLYVFPTSTTSYHMIKNAKNRCLIFILIIYVYP